MKFDVAITSYKRPELIKAAIKSCLKQGPLLKKIIVVDDASGDNTAEVIRSLDDPRIVFFQRHENGGIAAARRDAFALSDADWTISLDSDHELFPGAVEGMARLSGSCVASVDILGARYRWDTGRVSPVNIPEYAIGYEERIRLSAQKNNIGADYLCAISKRVRQIVTWEPLRTGFPDTLFQLDIAMAGDCKYTSETLGLQKSCCVHSWSRGTSSQRFTRRCKDASDGIKVLNLILQRHELGLMRYGKPMLAGMYCQGAFYAILSGQRPLARQWLIRSLQLGGLNSHWLGAALLLVAPHKGIKPLYLLRG